MHRLGQSIECVTFGRSFGQKIGRKRLTGKRQKPAIWTLRLEKNGKVDTIHFWENNIEDGQVRLPFHYDLKGLFRGVACAGLVAARRKNRIERIGNRMLVIDNQNLVIAVIHCGVRFPKAKCPVLPQEANCSTQPLGSIESKQSSIRQSRIERLRSQRYPSSGRSSTAASNCSSVFFYEFNRSGGSLLAQHPLRSL
jgi:hypothetical protein